MRSRSSVLLPAWRRATILVFVAAALSPGCIGAPAVATLGSTGGKYDVTQHMGNSPQPITVDSDGMDRFAWPGRVTFAGNVVARYEHSVHYADRMTMYLTDHGSRIERVTLNGNVRIVTRDGWTATASTASYSDRDHRAVLACHASIRRHKEVISGDSITIYLSSGRTVTMMEEWREPECQFSGVVTTRRPSGHT